MKFEQEMLLPSKFIQLAFQILIFLLLFFLFQYILRMANDLAFIAAGLAALACRPDLYGIGNDWSFNRKNARIKQILLSFREEINRTSQYHELIPQFYRLFNLLFPPKSWVFYIFENSNFRIVEFDTSRSEEGLPVEISFHSDQETINIIDLTRSKSLSDFDIGFDPTLFLAQQLDMLISVKGKSQIVSLLFTNRNNLDFLKGKSVRRIAENTFLKAAQILENTALYLDVIQRNLEIKKLFEVSRKLLSTLNTDDILDFLLEALAEVIHFDAGVIFLVDPERKKLYPKASKGYKENLDLTLKLGQGACGWVAETRQTSLLMDVSTARHYYPIRGETRSQVSIPMIKRDELMGVLSLESDQKNGFSKQSLELLNLFANQAIIALDNAMQYEVSVTKKLLEHELVNARKVQEVLLPQQPPNFSNLNISFVHLPSKLVSGDLFDLASIDQQTLGLVVGDVSGKGAGAAIMMSLVLAGFRAYKKSHLTVCEVVARLNNLLEESVSDGNYATLFYALISTEHNSVTFTNAGHNPPYLFRADGSLEELSGGGIVLGYLKNQTYKQTTVPFLPGDLLFTYTDGLTEALNIDGEEFGEERLKSVVRKNIHLNSYELKTRVLEEVDKFTESDTISDDRTLVIVKHL